jgi:hypothetical protein
MKYSLESVIEYLENNGQHPTGLTVKKIYSRGTFLEADEESGKIYFEVERHNAILGASYTPGCPMAAFVTRWIKYSFDGQDIHDLGDNRPPVIDIDEMDFYALAGDHTDDMSFSIEKDDKGKYRITEIQSNGDEAIVSSMEEVRAYARSIVEDGNIDYLMDTIEAPITEEEIQIILEMFSSAVIALAEEKAESAAESEGYFA